MERQKKVIDASVIVKLYANEESSDKAVQLREAHIKGNILIVISELTFLEVLNALRYKGNTDKLNLVAQELFDLQFHVEKFTDFILKKAIDIALKYDVTIYDASYVAIAQLYGVPMITADKKLVKIPNVILI